jgi:hypothetical protein
MTDASFLHPRRVLFEDSTGSRRKHHPASATRRTRRRHTRAVLRAVLWLAAVRSPYVRRGSPLSTAGFRESITLDTATHELIRAGLIRAAAVEAITGLVDARLLTSEERSGIRRIELTHDILTSLARRSRDARVEQGPPPRPRPLPPKAHPAYCFYLCLRAVPRRGSLTAARVGAARKSACAKAGRGSQEKATKIGSSVEEAARSDRAPSRGKVAEREGCRSNSLPRSGGPLCARILSRRGSRNPYRTLVANPTLNGHPPGPHPRG